MTHSNILPIAKKIAAQTMGLDLASVKPMGSPKGSISYTDYKYGSFNLGDLIKDTQAKILSRRRRKRIEDILNERGTEEG